METATWHGAECYECEEHILGDWRLQLSEDMQEFLRRTGEQTTHTTGGGVLSRQHPTSSVHDQVCEHVAGVCS